MAALLVAEACNAGLTPVTDPNNPAPPAGGCRLVDTAIDLAGLFEGECWVVEVHGDLRHRAPFLIGSAEPSAPSEGPGRGPPPGVQRLHDAGDGLAAVQAAARDAARSGASAVLQVTTWSSGVSSVVVLSSLGFKMEWFSNSVSSDSATCWVRRPSAVHPADQPQLLAARAPPTPP